MPDPESSRRTLEAEAHAWLRQARRRIEALRPAPRTESFGTITHAGDDIVRIAGLERIRLDELVSAEGGGTAFAVRIDNRESGCVVVERGPGLAAGCRVRALGAVVEVPVGERLLGRVVDALGRPLDDGPAIEADERLPVDRPAPPIIERDFVREPLRTGLLVVDTMFPIGRGQRELVLGDRKTGKTALAVDALLAQKDSDVVCVYAAIGQRVGTVRQVIDAVRAFGPFERSIFVVGLPESPPGHQWLVPFAACTMAEYFRDRGQHALLILDDLTKHADIHRQIALLLRMPPGREAYPGDVFYLHARLLERSARLAAGRGGGSLTALPIAETQAGNLSAYIPTNLISITDGQIYLEPRLFHEGQKPAVSVGLSVSRVGGKAQPPLLHDFSSRLRLEYAQFQELELFTRFGGVSDERTRRLLNHGRRIRFLLRQPQFRPLSFAQQLQLLIALNEGRLDRIAESRLEEARTRLLKNLPAGADRLFAPGQAAPADRRQVRQMFLEAIDAALADLIDGDRA